MASATGLNPRKPLTTESVGVGNEPMNIDTIMFLIQIHSVEVSDAQLKNMADGYQACLDKISALNKLKASLNKAMACFSSDAKAETTLSGNDKYSADGYAIEKEINSQAKALGIDLGLSDENAADGGGLTEGTDRLEGGIRGEVSMGKLKQMIDQISTNVDSLNQQTQMDMMKLQSCNNKRDERYQLATKLLAQLKDMISAILQNIGR